MTISLIVAMTRQGVIGRENALPWHIPEDLKRFKAITMGHPIIMGRKTYDSIGRPLPGRTNIVVTRDRQLKIPGVTVVHSLAEALRPYAQSNEEVFVIGGSSLFTEAQPLADRLYVTWVEQTFEGDTYFPVTDFESYVVHSESTPESKIPLTYVTYVRS
ncbi:MAG: dihydrofolate reductase [Bdellovibrionales bacterium]|nr:dihydrofolate reductase [Bdellovibrionales bacterium]